MNANQLLNSYRSYAAADADADAAFDLVTFPNLPERPTYTTEAMAGEVIARRGSVKAALAEAEAGIEDPDCSEQRKAAYQLIIEAAR